MSAETGRKKGSNEVVPSNGWEPAPLPRTGGAPERTNININLHMSIVNVREVKTGHVALLARCAINIRLRSPYRFLP